MQHVPADCWREKVDPAELLRSWAGLPNSCEMVNEFVAKMQPGDELWLYDIEAITGLAIRRSGEVVKTHNFLHVYCRPDLLVRWAGASPTVTEIIGLRKVDPSLRNKPVTEVKKLLGQSNPWRIEYLFSPELEAAESLLRECGMIVERV